MFSSIFLNIIFLNFLGFFENADLYSQNLLYIILFGSLSFFLLGIYDDIFKISPFKRLFIQFLISIFLWSIGLRIEILKVPFIADSNSLIYLNNFLSVIISSIWIVGLVNSINWIDGLDGLATTICLISSIGLAIIALINNHVFLTIWIFCIIGGSLGFLFYNFKPAKIFLGDGGSYLLGFSIAAANIIEFYSYDSTYNNNSQFQSFIPFLLVLVPILDMIFVILIRIKKGASPFLPDKNHIHHRMLNSGLGYNKSSFIIYFISIVFTAIGLSLEFA